MGIEEDAFSYYSAPNISRVRCPSSSNRISNLYSRRLKLVTGVEISTRPVRRSGSEGKPRKRRSRKAEAVPYRRAFRRSITILVLIGDYSNLSLEIATASACRFHHRFGRRDVSALAKARFPRQ